MRVFWSVWLQFSTHLGGKNWYGKKIISCREENLYILKNIYLCHEGFMALPTILFSCLFYKMLKYPKFGNSPLPEGKYLKLYSVNLEHA